MKKKRIKIVLIGILIVILISIGYKVFYDITGIGMPCFVHEVFHVYCPGCGITRLFFSLFQLDFYQAFRYNPLLFIYLPFIIFFAVDLLIAYINDRPTKVFGKIPNAIWIIILVITIGYGVIRNIEPFTFLSPTEVHEKNTK